MGISLQGWGWCSWCYTPRESWVPGGIESRAPSTLTFLCFGLRTSVLELKRQINEYDGKRRWGRGRENCGTQREQEVAVKSQEPAMHAGTSWWPTCCCPDLDSPRIWNFHCYLIPRQTPQTAHSANPTSVLPWAVDDCAEKPSLLPQLEASSPMLFPRHIRASENSMVSVGCVAVGGRRPSLSMS